MQENTDQENSEYGTFHAVGLSEKIRKSMDNESKQEFGSRWMSIERKFIWTGQILNECISPW